MTSRPISGSGTPTGEACSSGCGGRRLLELGIELGLVLERPPEWGPGPHFREFFTDRLIVPELRQGQAIWFIGRAAEDHPTRRPKYLSLPGQRPLLGLELVQGRRVVYCVRDPSTCWPRAAGTCPPAASAARTPRPSGCRRSRRGGGLRRVGSGPGRAECRRAVRPVFGAAGGPCTCQMAWTWPNLQRVGVQPDPIPSLVGRARAAAWQDEEIDPRHEARTRLPHLLEIVTPRTNPARLSAAEHLFGALGLASAPPGGARDRRADPTSAVVPRPRQWRGHGSHVAGQLGAAYPRPHCDPPGSRARGG